VFCASQYRETQNSWERYMEWTTTETDQGPTKSHESSVKKLEPLNLPNTTNKWTCIKSVLLRIINYQQVSIIITVSLLPTLYQRYTLSLKPSPFWYTSPRSKQLCKYVDNRFTEPAVVYICNLQACIYKYVVFILIGRCVLVTYSNTPSFTYF
jgi:hypothetical protein